MVFSCSGNAHTDEGFPRRQRGAAQGSRDPGDTGMAPPGEGGLVAQRRSFLNAVAWSPDRKYSASLGRDDTILVWEADSGRVRFAWRGHAFSLRAVSWSPDSSSIASGGWDATAQVWQPPLG